MIIIKSGKKNDDRYDVARIECSECNAVFEFDRREATKVFEDIYRIACPECGSYVFFGESLFKSK